MPSILVLVTFAAFLPALQNEFVLWDDDKNFLENRHYRGLGWTQLKWMWTTFHMGHYIPLTWMSFGLDYLLWGMNPLGYHLTSLLLHTTNAVVFYLVLLRLLGLALPDSREREAAGLSISVGFAALLFAIHPLRVESVAWATERRDVLSGFFYLLTILVYLRAQEPGEHARRWHWGSVALFVGALLSKSIAVSLPVVLVILDLYPLRRLGGPLGWWGKHARRVYAEKLPFVLLVAAASAVAFLALIQLNNMASLARLSVVGRLAVSAYGLGFYLWKMVIPLNLSPLYEMPVELNPWTGAFILSYGVVLALTALALALCRRFPGLLAAWVAYVVILLPVLGIFQNGDQIAADRYTYLACLGWASLGGAGLLSGWLAWRRGRLGRPISLLIAGFVVCAIVGLGVLTWKQAQVWRDTETLWVHALSIDRHSPVAHTNLGITLASKRNVADAIGHFRQALFLNPDFSKAHNNLGVMLAGQGRLDEAVSHYRQALRFKPEFAEAHSNLGLALVGQGKLKDAIEHYQHALQLRPAFAEAHYNLGIVLMRQGRLSKAIAEFQHALRINPSFREARERLDALLRLQSAVQTRRAPHPPLAE